MKSPSSEHGENKLCTEIVFVIQNNLCTQHVLPMFFKKRSFWQRFICTKSVTNTIHKILTFAWCELCDQNVRLKMAWSLLQFTLGPVDKFLETSLGLILITIIYTLKHILTFKIDIFNDDSKVKFIGTQFFSKIMGLVLLPLYFSAKTFFIFNLD